MGAGLDTGWACHAAAASATLNRAGYRRFRSPVALALRRTSFHADPSGSKLASQAQRPTALEVGANLLSDGCPSFRAKARFFYVRLRVHAPYFSVRNVRLTVCMKLCFPRKTF
jgi:hypothetical protein